MINELVDLVVCFCFAERRALHHISLLDTFRDKSENRYGALVFAPFRWEAQEKIVYVTIVVSHTNRKTNRKKMSNKVNWLDHLIMKWSFGGKIIESADCTCSIEWICRFVKQARKRCTLANCCNAHALRFERRKVKRKTGNKTNSSRRVRNACRNFAFRN